ncbi:MAG TPA: hypothetical protein VLF67_03835, partial [Candidatus Saccharimonas sp.]|nr:hypothetical protein [Candidatus Saccharimonas sp.]
MFALALSLATAPAALAADESYTWTDSGRTGFVATDGNFGTATYTFTKTSDTAGQFTFTATNVTFTCATATATRDLTIQISDAAYAAPGATLASKPEPTDGCGFTIATINSAGLNPVTGQVNTGSQPGDCNQGSLTWLLCPVLDNVSGLIAHLAEDVLVPLLKVNTITPTTTPGIYAVWSHMRDFSSLLFILIFIIVIIGTVMQQDMKFFDDYTLRKIWPRLIIAAVLVQFSFLLCSLLVDVGNVLGAGVQALFTGILPTSQGPPTLTNIILNLLTDATAVVFGVGAVAVLAAWPAAVPILISLLISLLVVFLTLGARFLIIAILIGISPLAFLAMILPNTRHFFRTWFEFLFRLIMMYPIVVAFITLAALANELLDFSGSPAGGAAGTGFGTVAAAAIKPILVIAAFASVIAAWKAATAVIGRVEGLLSRGADRGRSALKNTDFWQRGQAKRDERRAA